MISVVVLQIQMDLLRVEFVSCGETIDIKEEHEQERMTVPVIKMEPKVSCVLGDCVHISYRLKSRIFCPFISLYL
jgi:hypothetical protein